MGVLLQTVAIVCEALRVTMIQLLMQKHGIQLDAINTMLYISPTCLGFLLIPWAAFEATEVLQLQHRNVNAPLLAANMACAVGVTNHAGAVPKYAPPYMHVHACMSPCRLNLRKQPLHCSIKWCHVLHLGPAERIDDERCWCSQRLCAHIRVYTTYRVNTYGVTSCALCRLCSIHAC